MSGYCPDCGNTQCICSEVERQENAPSSCTVDSIVGCPVCGCKLVTIRGKHPGDPKRVVCPTCLADRMDTIRDMSDPNYGIGCAANVKVEASDAGM